jgi:ATP-dependent RNA helicase RhlE
MAISMYDVSEQYHVRHIEKLIRQRIEELPIPDPAIITETSLAERQDQNREIDRQKRLEDPEFKGAFHEKKFQMDKEQDKKLKSKASKKPKKKSGFGERMENMIKEQQKAAEEKAKALKRK